MFDEIGWGGKEGFEAGFGFVLANGWVYLTMMIVLVGQGK